MTAYPLEHILSDSTRSPYLKVVAALLDKVVDESKSTETVFDARVRPSISLHEYLRRWMKYTRCGAATVVAAVALMDRVCKLHSVPITVMNVHRFLLATLTVSSKVCVDVPYHNSHYAQVGGVPLKDVNFLERQVVTLLDFNVLVSEVELDTYVEMFQEHQDWPRETSEDVLTQSHESLLLRRRSIRSMRCSIGGSSENGLSETRTSLADTRTSISRYSCVSGSALAAVRGLE